MSKELSILVPNKLPAFINAEHKIFVDFVQAYYQWTELNGNVQEKISHIPENRNIDLTSNDLVEKFRLEYLQGIPTSTLASKRLLVKHIKDFYRVKGTEAAYRFLFRILFNEDVAFYYPGRDILRASDGKWFIKKALRTNGISADFQKLKSRRITGQSSGATAIVEDATQFITPITGKITEYSISNILGVFQVGEIITGTDESGDIEFTENILPVYTSITITNTGTGYAKEDTFSIKNTDIDSNGEGTEIISIGKITSIQNGATSGPIRNYQIDEFGLADFSHVRVDLTGSGDGNATATANLGALLTYPGVWLTTDSFLSSEKKLEDNFYYQDFSYELRSLVSIELYRDLVKAVNHPAGMLFFGKVLSSLDDIAKILEVPMSFEDTVTTIIKYFLNVNIATVNLNTGTTSINRVTNTVITGFYTTYGEVPLIKLWGALNHPINGNPFYPGLDHIPLNTLLPQPIPFSGPYSPPFSDINIRHLGSNDSNN